MGSDLASKGSYGIFQQGVDHLFATALQETYDGVDAADGDENFVAYVEGHRHGVLLSPGF
jgi:hypothetical protein